MFLKNIYNPCNNVNKGCIRYIEHKKCFYILITLILLTDLAALLNISFLRQIIGFLFLSLLPGLLILQILKLNKLDFLEKSILSWGLSLSFLMFFGLLINNLSLSLCYETPLSITPLFISLNLAFILLLIIGYKTNKEAFSFTTPDFNLNTAEKAFLIVPISFPALSIFGMNLMNTTDNNIILMFLLFSIPIYVAFVCFFNKIFPKRLYPVVLFLISISLLLLLSLRSNHLIGMDVHTEYYLFRITLDNSHWSIQGHSALDACLAISLLPTIYQSILNVHTEYLYKILYSLLCSVFPVIVYIISKKYIEEGYAFLASMYFMSNNVFLWTEYNARANIAMLFFAFAMMTLFNNRIDPLKKRILFIVFTASGMVSHYSNTYLFFFIMVVTFIGMEILSKKYTFKKVISLTFVILFFAMMFFWYSQVTETAFDVGVSFIEKTIRNLNQFFVAEIKSEPAQLLLGKGIMLKGIVYRIHWVLTWMTFALIGIGIITLIGRYKEMSFSELNFKKPDFLKDKFEVVYFVVALACVELLVATIALPYVSDGYGLGRSYLLTSTILAVFFVIGGIILSKHFFFLEKRKPVLKEKNNRSFGKAFFSKGRFEGKNGSEARAYLIILLVLIPYFLCITGVMYNIFGDPRAITLNSEGKEYDLYYVHDQESYSAKWLGKLYVEQNNPKIYATTYGGKGLLSIGKITSVDRWALTERKKIEGYIYLGYYNIINGKLIDESTNMVYNMTEYSDMFVGKSMIYNNGCSEVWR